MTRTTNKNKLKLLHVISDEKFLDSAYKQFEEVVPGANVYLLPELHKPIKYIKSFKPIRVTRYSFLNPLFIRSLRKYDAVIIHSMTDFSLELIARSDEETNFVWIGMGFDYYDLIYENPYEMLETETCKTVKKIMPRYGVKVNDNPVKRMLKYILYKNISRKKSIVKKVSIFCPVIYTEFKSLERVLGHRWTELMPWNYGVISKLLDSEKLADSCTGRNILVGNSATPTNNHIEVFNVLKNMPLHPETKIIVPLSYGSEIYRDYLISLGHKIFGDRFVPVTSFMDFEEYVELIASCYIAIMNHIRQQGAGNISISLYTGSMVFLNESNPLYDYYQEQGFKVFSFNELEEVFLDFKNYHSNDWLLRNRSLMVSTRGHEVNIGKTTDLVNKILEISNVYKD